MLTNADITVINQQNGKYIATHISGVAYFDTVKTTVTERGLISADTVEIYIPCSALSSNELTLLPQKTFIVNGVVDVASMTLPEMLDKYSVKTVISVSANLFGSESMKHWEVLCK